MRFALAATAALCACAPAEAVLYKVTLTGTVQTTADPAFAVGDILALEAVFDERNIVRPDEAYAGWVGFDGLLPPGTLPWEPRYFKLTAGAFTYPSQAQEGPFILGRSIAGSITSAPAIKIADGQVTNTNMWLKRIGWPLLLSGGNGFLIGSDVSSLTVRGTWDFAGSSVVQLDPIPEPSAWALLIVGFGATGAMLRAGRHRPSAPNGRRPAACLANRRAGPRCSRADRSGRHG